MHLRILPIILTAILSAPIACESASAATEHVVHIDSGDLAGVVDGEIAGPVLDAISASYRVESAQR